MIRFYDHAKKIYINNYFKLICSMTTLNWKNYIYIYTLKKYILFTKLTYFDHLIKILNTFT